jgi:hypothetical protein
MWHLQRNYYRKVNVTLAKKNYRKVMWHLQRNYYCKVNVTLAKKIYRKVNVTLAKKWLLQGKWDTCKEKLSQGMWDTCKENYRKVCVWVLWLKETTLLPVWWDQWCDDQSSPDQTDETKTQLTLNSAAVSIPCARWPRLLGVKDMLVIIKTNG